MSQSDKITGECVHVCVGGRGGGDGGKGWGLPGACRGVMSGGGGLLNNLKDQVGKGTGT